MQIHLIFKTVHTYSLIDEIVRIINVNFHKAIEKSGNKLFDKRDFRFRIPNFTALHTSAL